MHTLHKFHDIVREYSRLQIYPDDIRLLSLPRWKQDTVDLQALNDSLMNISMKIVEQLLIPNSEEVKATGQAPGHDDVRHIAWELLEEARLGKGGQTWGDKAKKLIQGIYNMMHLIS